MTRSALLRRALGAAVGTALTAVALGVSAAPAGAHSALVDSTPREGQTLTAAPTTIELTYSEDVQEIGAFVALRDADDAVVAELEPRISGAVVTAQVPTTLAAGRYSVVWRVVSSDGHPIQGAIPFSVEGAAPSPTPTPSPETTAPPAKADQTDAASEEDDSDGTPVLVVALAAVAAVVALGTAALVARRRNRTRTNRSEENR
ncbi:copper resistance CopC family protein [Mumia quercus]|uniref:copper resistance CopC family protein n=1 Tax=Mumia quercus TaxID=2976125 RepID=UPI0021D1E0FD|nr:copper resistance CopC family protein [Mumia quercus]